MSNQLPLAQTDPNPTLHDDVDTSAWHALDGLGDDGQEQAGLILQTPEGKYTYTHPLSSAQHDHFGFRAALQQGWKIAGIYHTHPGSDADGQVFSPDDLAMAAQLKVPSYIRFLKGGAVRKYVPGQTALENLPAPGNRFPRKVAVGDPLDGDTMRAKLAALKQRAQQAAPTT